MCGHERMCRTSSVDIQLPPPNLLFLFLTEPERAPQNELPTNDPLTRPGVKKINTAAYKINRGIQIIWTAADKAAEREREFMPNF